MSLNFADPIVRPQYRGRCFADLPPFISTLLTGNGVSHLQPTHFDRLPQRYRRVVFLFLDAFGWTFFQRTRDRYPFLRRFEAEGSVTQLTSQFPSTTAAHVTTLQTGLPVGQHGVFEWNYYEPQIDRMITPLLFSLAGDKMPGTLLSLGVQPEAILPSQSLGQDLQSHGVTTHAFLHASYAGSPYNAIINRNNRLRPYKTLPETLVNLRLLLEQEQGPGFYFLYYDGIDAVGHDYGPGSPQVEAELEALLTVLDRWIMRDLGRVGADTLLMITADHGQTAVDPAAAIYLNRLPAFAELSPLLRVNGEGRPLVAAGSPRDMFLYVKDGFIAEAQDRLSDGLEGKADVVNVTDLIDEGFFGPPPVSEAFRSRAGDLVILPRPGETVWWYEKGRFEQRFRGHHGGLSADEMEIPLLLLPLA